MKIAELSGAWSGSVRTWLDPAGEPLDDRISGTFRPAPGGTSVVHEYESGLMLIGRSIETGKDCLAWVDSFHTGGGMMLFESDGDSFRGAYAAGDQVWRWRISIRTVADELQIDHFNISPDGREDRAIEIRYRRV